MRQRLYQLETEEALAETREKFVARLLESIKAWGDYWIILSLEKHDRLSKLAKRGDWFLRTEWNNFYFKTYVSAFWDMQDLIRERQVVGFASLLVSVGFNAVY